MLDSSRLKSPTAIDSQSKSGGKILSGAGRNVLSPRPRKTEREDVYVVELVMRDEHGVELAIEIESAIGDGNAARTGQLRKRAAHEDGYAWGAAG